MQVESAYIHIPFCSSICSYCDFCKMFYNREFVDKYLDKLKEEVNISYKDDILKTLYIGGGTPSCLKNDELDKLFEITSIFNLSDEYEFTFEINVNDLNDELLKKIKNNKVNRISIGIETINEKFQNKIDRVYTKEYVYEKVTLAKKYFNNINVDFMYGFNGETLDDLKNDLEFFESLDVEHISIYSLILEKNTKLYINNEKQIDDEVESNMYFYIIDYLNNIGFNHYEISNFSKPGFESKHNLTYWDNKNYYGFGLGASGYTNNIRYSNTRSLNNYLAGRTVIEKEIINDQLDMQYEMILGLRKTDGVSIECFYDKFNKDIKDVFDIDLFIKQGLLVYKNNRLFIPKKYLFVSNQILEKFL